MITVLLAFTTPSAFHPHPGVHGRTPRYPRFGNPPRSSRAERLGLEASEKNGAAKRSHHHQAGRARAPDERRSGQAGAGGLAPKRPGPFICLRFPSPCADPAAGHGPFLPGAASHHPPIIPCSGRTQSHGALSEGSARESRRSHLSLPLPPRPVHVTTAAERARRMMPSRSFLPTRTPLAQPPAPPTHNLSYPLAIPVLKRRQKRGAVKMVLDRTRPQGRACHARRLEEGG
jgi:hypothetical protein